MLSRIIADDCVRAFARYKTKLHSTATEPSKLHVTVVEVSIYQLLFLKSNIIASRWMSVLMFVMLVTFSSSNRFQPDGPFARVTQ